MDNPLQFGSTELPVADFALLVGIAGPVGEQDSDPGAIFLRFERETYTRAEVMRVCEIIARMRPDESSVDDKDLRLWWD